MSGADATLRKIKKRQDGMSTHNIREKLKARTRIKIRKEKRK